jgi:transcriptional regulator with XRE-family HTH domain
MAKRRKVRTAALGAPSLGRVLAVLRTTLDLTQADLSRLSGVKRASISEYERDVTTPDASILARLLAAMRFRWSAVDLGSWFVERLEADCRVAEGSAGEPPRDVLLETTAAEAARLGAQAAEVTKAAARLHDLVRVARLCTGCQTQASGREDILKEC